MIDIYFRCITRARWLTLAQNRDLIDENGQPRLGVAIDEIGNYVITPAVMDDMTVATPAQIDNWWTVNVRLFGARAAEDEDVPFPDEENGQWRFLRSKLVRFIRENATLVNLNVNGNNVRAYQFGTGAQRVQILDPRDMGNVPRTQWAGGMYL